MYKFSKCEIMVSKYGYLMLPGAFPGKVIPDIDFKDEVVVQCVIPVVEILMQVPVIYQYLKINSQVNTYDMRALRTTVSGPSFVYSCNFVIS